jgi:hypothetical protein
VHRDIAENVDGADSFLFVVSADSLAPENCGVELTRVKGANIRVQGSFDSVLRTDAPHRRVGDRPRERR